jgi:hypothetical protein
MDQTGQASVPSIQCADVMVPTRQHVGVAVPGAPGLVDRDSLRAIVQQTNQIDGIGAHCHVIE